MRWYDKPERVLRYLWLISRMMLIVIGPMTGLLDTVGPNFNAYASCRSCLIGLTMLSPQTGWITAGEYQIGGGSDQILRRENDQWYWDFLPVTGITSISALTSHDVWATYTYTDYRDSTFTTYTGLLHNHDGQWAKLPLVVRGDFSGLTMVSPTEGWAIESTYTSTTYHIDSTLVHYSGNDWQRMSFPQVRTYYALAFAGTDDGWLVGEKGFIAHLNGGVWQTLMPFTQDDLVALQVRAPNDIWAMTMTGMIWQSNGQQWHLVNTDAPTFTFYAPRKFIVMAPDDIWVLQGFRESSLRASKVWHYTQGNWQPADLSDDYFTDLAMVTPDEGWAVGVRATRRNGDGDINAGDGVIAHYQHGTWQVALAPREREPWWLVLLRSILIGGMLVALGFVAAFIRLSSVLESPSLLKTWYARVGLFFTALGIGGAFLVIGEPLLFPQYKAYARLLGVGIALVGLITALIAIALLERKHKRTPTPVNPDALVVQPARDRTQSSW